jgi:3-hydroxyisobutyrate dehydrogenase-like beta-hydroxyacid dehydrogenase
MTRLVLDWAQDAGLDQDKLLGLIDTATGQNWFTSRFNAIEFAKQGFELDNTLGILAKDVSCALDAAPLGADKTLPELIRQSLLDLKPI